MPNFTTLLGRRFSNSPSDTSAGVRHKRRAHRPQVVPYASPCATTREGARDLFGRVRDDVAGTGYRLYERSGESYGFSIVSRGRFDLAAVELSVAYEDVPRAIRASNDTSVLKDRLKNRLIFIPA